MRNYAVGWIPTLAANTMGNRKGRCVCNHLAMNVEQCSGMEYESGAWHYCNRVGDATNYMIGNRTGREPRAWLAAWEQRTSGRRSSTMLGEVDESEVGILYSSGAIAI